MCGRFVFSHEVLDEVEKIAIIPEYVQEELHFSDIYPSQKSLVLKKEGDHLLGEALAFGFHSDYFKKRIINARAQGIESKWMFKNALKNGRVLVPCAGFYEWSPARIKTYFFKDHDPVLYLAALQIEDGFVIITTHANASMEAIHPRMPLILPLHEAKEWLMDPTVPYHLLQYKPIELDKDMPSLF